MADEKAVMAILAADAAQAEAMPATLGQGTRALRKRAVIGRAFRPLAWLRLWVNFFVEKWFARRRSRELLEAFQRVQSAEAQLSGKELYARVVIDLGFSPKEAQTVLLRAEQSFCEWPMDHQLRFQDVARYVVVTEYLRSHVASTGTHTNMGSAVAGVIPDDL